MGWVTSPDMVALGKVTGASTRATTEATTPTGALTMSSAKTSTGTTGTMTMVASSMTLTTGDNRLAEVSQKEDGTQCWILVQVAGGRGESTVPEM